MFQFGILGCGMIASIHADAIGHIENAVLRGVSDMRLEKAQAFAEKHSTRAYSSYEEMLADEEIDAVCICTPSCFHAANAIEALEKGKHVVLEKPMALSSQEADGIIAACERTGRRLTVICQLRFSGDIQRAKRLIEDGAFGKLSFCGLYMKYYRSKEYYASSDWKGSLQFDGGGALMNQGIHGIDLMEYLMGGVEDVQGQIATLSHEIEVEDTAVATVKFENGALGVIVGSTCAYPGFERRIEIHGDDGYVILNENRIAELMINGNKMPTVSAEASKTASDPGAVQSDMHRLQIENFIRAVHGEADLLIDCREGKKAIRIIEQIYKRG